MPQHGPTVGYKDARPIINDTGLERNIGEFVSAYQDVIIDKFKSILNVFYYSCFDNGFIYTELYKIQKRNISLGVYEFYKLLQEMISHNNENYVETLQMSKQSAADKVKKYFGKSIFENRFLWCRQLEKTKSGVLIKLLSVFIFITL